jgi:glycosyltransferase involved in cell wall biosynthesis
MRTVHLVYVKGNGRHTPVAITNELARRLQAHYRVEVHDWASAEIIRPSAGDVLIGHPHPLAETVFRRSFSMPGWGKRLVMLPFRHGPWLSEIGWWDPLICRADWFLAICAPYWTDTMSRSWTSHWSYKTVQVDLAVDQDHFPFIKHQFNPPGRRKFLFIGSAFKHKGFEYLLEIVHANPQFDFGWIGWGDHTIECPGMARYGKRDFSVPENLELVKSYDFMLTCGRSDANPTSILEAASWGLVPVCTPQSGYYNQNWIVNIPLDDVDGASTILRNLNAIPEGELREFQVRGRKALSKHYTWDRFAAQVRDCIEKPSPGVPSGVKWKVINGRNRNVLLLYGVMARLTPIKVIIQQFVHFLRARWWKIQTVLKSS